MNTFHQFTQCVHSGTLSDEADHGVNSPLYLSSANDYRNGTIYPRYFNKFNQTAIENKVADLEHGQSAVLFSSGMAAISTTLFSVLNKGDHAIFLNELYGGTLKFIHDDFDRMGIAYSFTEGPNPDSFADLIQPNTKVIYVESPTNPLLTIVDLEKTASLARDRNILAIIDNTLASPINQHPLKLGFDISIHSGTKYLGGHSDLSFGIAVAKNEGLTSEIRSKAQNLGGCLNILDCYIVERSLKTLALRVKQQNENANALAGFLSGHHKVKKVYYPGLDSHPGHKLAKSQMTEGYGGIVSFEIDGGLEQSDKLLDNLKLIRRALSLGGIETTICSPAKTSHEKLTSGQREKIGIKDNLLRLSVGIEHVDDLINDLESALNTISYETEIQLS